MTNSADAYKASNISSTTAAFRLSAGLVQLAVVATWGGGSVSLAQLGPDGTTYLTVASLTANGVTTASVPAGQFKLVIVTSTAVYASVVGIPS